MRAARVQARERALGGPGEQVVAGRQYRAAGTVTDLRAHRDQRGERRLGAGTVRAGEHLGGQLGERPGCGGQQDAQPRHRLLVREQQRGIAVPGAPRPAAAGSCAARSISAAAGIGRGGQGEIAGRAERPPQRPGRDVHPLRTDQVLARRVAVHPLERGVEQLGGEVRHRLRMVADGGARGDRLERRVVLAAPDAFAEPAQQHADLLGLGAVVDVRLVEHDEPPVPAVLSLEQFHVGRAEQQVLEHRVVGEQQVRRVVAHLLTAEQLVRQPWLARVQRLVRATRPRRRAPAVSPV